MIIAYIEFYVADAYNNDSWWISTDLDIDNHRLY